MKWELRIISRDASGPPEPESNYDEKFVVASISNFFKACDTIRSFVPKPLNCGRAGCRKLKQPPVQANYIELNRAAPNIKSSDNCPTNLAERNKKVVRAGRLDKKHQSCPDKHAQNFRPIRAKYANLKANSIVKRYKQWQLNFNRVETSRVRK